jgi:hypothetical protein
MSDKFDYGNLEVGKNPLISQIWPFSGFLCLGNSQGNGPFTWNAISGFLPIVSFFLTGEFLYKSVL